MAPHFGRAVGTNTNQHNHVRMLPRQHRRSTKQAAIRCALHERPGVVAHEQVGRTAWYGTGKIHRHPLDAQPAGRGEYSGSPKTTTSVDMPAMITRCREQNRRQRVKTVDRLSRSEGVMGRFDAGTARVDDDPSRDSSRLRRRLMPTRVTTPSSAAKAFLRCPLCL